MIILRLFSSLHGSWLAAFLNHLDVVCGEGGLGAEKAGRDHTHQAIVLVQVVLHGCPGQQDFLLAIQPIIQRAQ